MTSPDNLYEKEILPKMSFSPDLSAKERIWYRIEETIQERKAQNRYNLILMKILKPAFVLAIILLLIITWGGRDFRHKSHTEINAYMNDMLISSYSASSEEQDTDHLFLID